MRRIFFSLLIILFSTNFLISQDLNIYTYTLENGLTVILNEDHSSPKVFGNIVCKAGGKDDPDDATGMAHYQEHMLFKGTQTIGTLNWEAEKVHIDKIFELYDKLGQTTDETERLSIQKQINEESIKANEYVAQNELSNLIKSIGGTDLNAGTGWDMTVYYNAFPPNQLEKWLDLYSDRFENPVFRGFQQELEVVYEEKNLYSDIFIFPLLEKFNNQFFKNHPYGQQTLIGSIDDLKNPSLTKMYAFYKTYYVPNNMALIISGDFNKEKIMPMIKEKFGDWKSSSVPEKKKYEEVAFVGREFVETRLSPIKLEFLGFRTAPTGHQDELVLKIFHSLLSNSNQTGLFDKLIIDNKLLAAQVIPMPYFDHGATIFLGIPKIIGQSLEEVEKLLLDEVKKLKNGEIDEKTLESIKNQLYIENQLNMENMESINYAISTAFALGKDINEYLKLNEKIKDIKIEDIKNVANKYFSDNYLVMYSKMGSFKKEKIQKPEYAPLISKTDAKSEYAKKFEAKKAEDYTVSYINFDKDIITEKLGENKSFYYTVNDKNDIFSMNLRFGIGKNSSPLLTYTSEIMSVAGSKDYDAKILKEKFSELGAQVNFKTTDNSFYVEVTGIESNLEATLNLLNSFLIAPAVAEEKIKLIIEAEASSRKMERSETDGVADALKEYVMYKDKSSYIDRLSTKEIKALTTAQLVEEYKKAIGYALEVHYVGSPKIIKYTQVMELINKELTFIGTLKPAVEVFDKEQEYKENTVFFVDKSKAIQSKIYLFSNGNKYNINETAETEAFNLYFGGDFSGLVLQEIREARSLAYGAGARIVMPNTTNNNKYFVGYVGTQADKTLEAMEVFEDLITNMPAKPERTEMIKNYLLLSSITDRPNFRELSMQIKYYQKLGYTEDPAKTKMKKYSSLTFEDINNFYAKELKTKPIAYAIVGDKKQIDLKKLKKHGNVIIIKEKSLFKL